MTNSLNVGSRRRGDRSCWQSARRRSGFFAGTTRPFAHALRAERSGRRCPQREQPLVRADVARRLLAADVLLAGLERQHPAALAVAVGRLADEPAGDLADELLAAGQDAEVRPAVAQARPAPAPRRRRCPPRSRRAASGGQAHRVEAATNTAPAFRGRRRQGARLFEVAEEVRLLRDHADRRSSTAAVRSSGPGSRAGGERDQLDAEMFAT